MTEREILAFNAEYSMMAALIPKSRGKGFLKVPAGHHYDPRIAMMEEEIGASLFGLDGCLEVDTFNVRGHQWTALWERFLGSLAKHYTFPVRVVDAAEFWEHHPSPGLRKSSLPESMVP